MEKLYAPWRQNYVQDVNKKRKKAGCVFCDHIKSTDDDEKNFVIKRYQHSIVMLNLYPYNAGHILVLPKKHCKELSELSVTEQAALMHTLTTSIALLKKTLKPDGFNVGISLGKAAGAGIPGHLHIHILPRWEGDTNFLPLLAETKQISVDLVKLYQQLKRAFDK